MQLFYETEVWMWIIYWVIQIMNWTVPKYRSTNVYTSSYIRHLTLQCEVSQLVGIRQYTL